MIANRHRDILMKCLSHLGLIIFYHDMRFPGYARSARCAALRRESRKNGEKTQARCSMLRQATRRAASSVPIRQ
jgi:hypothetical protein